MLRSSSHTSAMTCSSSSRPCWILEFFLNGNAFCRFCTFYLINPWSMNWAQFKDPLCYLCLHSAVVSSLFLMQEVVGSRLILFAKIFYKFCRFYRINLGTTWLFPLRPAWYFIPVMEWFAFSKGNNVYFLLLLQKRWFRTSTAAALCSLKLLKVHFLWFSMCLT